MEFLILNRGQIETFKPEMPYITIGATEPNKQKPNIFKNQHYISDLRLYYSDIDEDFTKHYPSNYLFAIDHARILLGFYKRFKDKTELIICQCDGGICRSSAMAAALSVIHNGPRSDNWIFESKCYNPNMHVYRTLLNTAMEMNLL